jgi:hypothetical protein
MKRNLCLLLSFLSAACGGSVVKKHAAMSPYEWASYMYNIRPHNILWLPVEDQTVFFYTATEGLNVRKGNITDTAEFVNGEIGPYAKSFIKASDSLCLPFWFYIMGLSSDGKPHLRVQFYEKTGSRWRYQVIAPHINTGLRQDSLADILY